MKRFPLYARVLCWFFGIAALLGGALVWALRSSAAGDWLMMQQAEPRVQSISRLLMQELQPLPVEEWDAVLEKYSRAHRMDFALFAARRRIAGREIQPPPEVLSRLPDRPPPANVRPAGVPAGNNIPGRPGFPPNIQPGTPPFRENNGGFFRPESPAGQGAPFPPEGERPPRQGAAPQWDERRFPKFLTTSPEAHWLSVILPLRQPEPAGNTALVLRITDPADSGLAMDFTPWLWSGAGLLVLASLLWLIPVRAMTRTVRQMQRATADIAAGQFDVQVPSERRDELGELAAEINRLGTRLSGFVTGQKRFLGDIAHELCAPVARMQMAGAVLEQRVPEELRERIQDLNSDVESMSVLVSELLDFTRAGLVPKKVTKSLTPLRELAVAVLEREGAADRTELSIPPELTALVNPGLLSRALGNVIRNALRYAGPLARLEVAGAAQDGTVRLTVSDDGPGVPPEALPRLFDPFFRLEEARDRESGGTGLGLAIVKTCVESFGGSVSAENCPGGGLAVAFRLPAAGA